MTGKRDAKIIFWIPRRGPRWVFDPEGAVSRIYIYDMAQVEMDPWRPIRRRDAWRPRLSVLRTPTVVALIVEFAGSDERIICQLAGLEWNTTQRLWRVIVESNRLWQAANSVVIEQLQHESWAAEVADELDLWDGADGSSCICSAVYRGWASQCRFCEMQGEC